MRNWILSQHRDNVGSISRKAALAGLLLLTVSARAANTWDGGSTGPGNNLWSTPENWDNDTAPAFPAALLFGSGNRFTTTNDLVGATVTGITFTAGAGAFTHTGNAVTLAGNVAILVTAGAVTNDQTLSLPITLGTNVTLSSALVGGNTVVGKGVLIVNSAISGPYGLNVSGKNYVQFNGANSYSGDTVITSANGDGSFSIGNTNAFGTGRVIVGATPGTSQVWLQPCGNLTLTNAFEVRTQRFIVAGYTVGGRSAGTLTLSGNVVLNQGGGGQDFWCQKELTLSGTVSGGGMNGLRMASGKMILTGANTFTNHLVSNYALQTPTFNINSDAAMGHTNNGVKALTGSVILQTAAGTAINLAPSRTFTVSTAKTLTFDVPANSVLSVPGLISGGVAPSNTLAKTGAGTVVLSGANTYVGNTALNGGVLNINSDAALGSASGAVNFTGNGTLQSAISNLTLNSGRSVLLTNAGTYAASFDVPTNSVMTVAGVFRGNTLTNSALTKIGPGMLVLAGGSSDTALGGMNVQAGTLSIQSGTWYTAPANTADSTVFNVTGGATYEQTGGTNYLPVYACVSQQYIGGATTNLTSTGILSGGSMVGMELMIGRRNSAVMTISGNALLDLYALKLGELEGYTTVCNLDGGIVDCNYIASRGTNATLTTSVLNFNGGTLRAKNTAGAANLIGGFGNGTVSFLSKVNVKSGGAVIDSRSYAVAIPQVLSHDADLGPAPDGGLTKRGSGSLTLATNNTYTGVTRIEAGTLKLGVANALASSGLAVVAEGATLDLNGKAQSLSGLGGSGLVTNCGLLTVTQGVAPGSTNTIGRLTLASSPAALSGVFLADVAFDGTCDALHVQGNLDLSGVSLQLSNAQALNKDEKYVVASYTGTLAGTFASAVLPDRWNVRYDAAAKQVFLSYDFGTQLRLL